MATKKSASTTKKKPTTKKSSATTSSSKTAAKKPATTTTKVTTTTASAVTKRRRTLGRSFGFSGTPVMAAAVAEFVGAFVLAGVYLVTQAEPYYTSFALVAIVLMLGALSGAHFNPAMTVGAWVTKRVSSWRAVAYIVAQVLGALLALVAVNAFVSGAAEPTAQQQLSGQSAATLFTLGTMPQGKEWALLFAELLGSTVLAVGVASAIRVNRDRLTAAFTIGGSLFVALLVTSYMVKYLGGTTTVLNPAVAFSLQGVSWSWMPIATYVLAPLVGGILGFGLQDLLSTDSDE